MTATRAPSRHTPLHPPQAAMHRSAYSSPMCSNWPPGYASRQSSMTPNTFHQSSLRRYVPLSPKLRQAPVGQYTHSLPSTAA